VQNANGDGAAAKGCVEMLGTEQDWGHLLEKLNALRILITPIESTINMKPVLDYAETIYKNLLRTYQNDPNMATWWSKILIDCKATEYGPSGMRRGEVNAYNGWLVEFCTGAQYPLKAKELASGGYKDKLSVLTSCPMKIVDYIRKIEDDSTLIAGILGYKIHKNTPNEVTSLEPAHGWCLLLPENSKLR